MIPGAGVGAVELHGKAPKIALFGNFGIDNFGNDASLAAMLCFLRRVCPGGQLTSISTDPEVVERIFSVASIRINLPSSSGGLFRVFDRLLLRLPRTLDLLLRTLRNARNIDVLIIPGTGILEEPSHRLTRIHWTLFLWCAAAKISRKKIAFVSVGAASINNRVVRWLLTTAFRMADYGSFRDESSRQCISKVGVDVQNTPVYPDLVFGPPEFQGLPGPIAKGDDPLTVGLGLMSLWGWYNEGSHRSYIDKMVEFALFLVHKGHRVRVLIADKGDRSAVDDFLRGIMRKDKSLLNDQIIAEHIVCAEDLVRQIALTDVVICSRFHNIVYALKLGKPVVSIGYSSKHRALMEEVGLGEFIQAAQEIDVPLLQEQFLDLLKDRKMYEQNIQRVIARFEELLGQQERILSARFLGSRQS